MDLDLVIKSGRIFNSAESFTADVGVKNGKITVIGKSLDGQASADEIDARGCFVFPGGIDVHTHFQLPFGGTVSADDFENGTKAAACGGVTTVIDFAIQKKGGSLVEAVKKRQAEADGKVCIDYSLHAAITDWNETTRKEFRQLAATGVPSFKMFMIYRNEGWMADDAALFGALEESSRCGAMVSVHAESAIILDLLVERMKTNPQRRKLGAWAHALTRPNYVEYEAVQRAATWAEATRGRLYIVHMSTGEAADIVRNAKERAVQVYAETCPQYLLLDDGVFRRKDGHLFATCPQIKSRMDGIRLWQGLASGDVSVIATDTCTFTKKQKAMWNGDFTKIPFGLPGVENLLPLTFSEGPAKGRFSLSHWVGLISTNPAKLFGLYPQKGVIQIGADADIVVWDPKRRFKITPANLQTNCDWSPYEGYVTKGYPKFTLSKGKIVAKEGKFFGEAGWGRFVTRKPWGSLS